MFELFVFVLFVWLSVKAIGLAFKVTWGLAKITAVVMFVLAIPALLISLLVVGGLTILIPVGLLAAAVGILKSCA